MENILIPTDFSKNARNALRYALSFFSNVSVKFHLLHVISSNEHKELSLQDALATKQENTSADPSLLLEKEIEHCTKTTQNPTHRFHTITKESPLIETIRNCVEEYDIDYIVLGTRGATKSNSEGIGSNAHEVVTKVKCPVIVIPEEAKNRTFKNIALPTDYNNWDTNRMLTNLYEMLLIKQANLHILQIQTKNQSPTKLQEETKDIVQELFKSSNHTYHTVNNNNLDDEIQNYVDKSHIDMIAVVGRNLNFAQRLLFRPKKKTIKYHLNTPFLVLHE